MATLQQVREDLREIRYYYSRRKLFDTSSTKIVQSSVLDKITKYNMALKNAPAYQYGLYVALYVQNNTQKSLSHNWNCSVDNIKHLNKLLCNYLLSVV